MLRTAVTTALVLSLGGVPAASLAQSHMPPAPQTQPQQATPQTDGSALIGLLLGALAIGIIAKELSDDDMPETPVQVPRPPNPRADDHVIIPVDPLGNPYAHDYMPDPMFTDVVPRACVQSTVDRHGRTVAGVARGCLLRNTGFHANDWCGIDQNYYYLDCMLDLGWTLEGR